MIPVLRTITVSLLLTAALAGPAPAAPEPPEPVGAAAEFSQRRAALSPGDHAAAMKLAEWGIEQGLLEQADDLYRWILRADPDHEVAYAALWSLSGGRTLAKESPEYDRTRALLPESFREHDTTHYIVLSDADPAWVREQAKRLERAYDRFVWFARALGLRPLPIQHRLVAVLFSHVEDFAKFAGHDGLAETARIAGYYSVGNDRLVFYHVESSENVAAMRDQLAQMGAEIDAVRQASRRVSRTGRRSEGRQMLEELEPTVQRHETQLEQLNAFARQRSIVVTVHEAIHQLMFHTHVQSPYAPHPLWLSEGLATAFETDDPSSSFGPLQDFGPRRDQFYHLLDNGLLLPLEKLVTINDRAGSDPQTIDAVYGQSYALVSWMCRARKLQLADYIRRLNAMRPGAASAEKYRQLFEESFGDIERLERTWLLSEGAG